MRSEWNLRRKLLLEHWSQVEAIANQCGEIIALPIPNLTPREKLDRGNSRRQAIMEQRVRSG